MKSSPKCWIDDPKQPRLEVIITSANFDYKKGKNFYLHKLRISIIKILTVKL